MRTPKEGEIWVRKSSGVRWKVTGIKKEQVSYRILSVDRTWEPSPRYRPIENFLLHFRPLSSLEQFLEGMTDNDRD